MKFNIGTPVWHKSNKQKMVVSEHNEDKTYFCTWLDNNKKFGESFDEHELTDIDPDGHSSAKGISKRSLI